MVIGIVLSAVLVIQTLALPYGNVISSLFSDVRVPVLVKGSVRSEDSSVSSAKVGELHSADDLVNTKDSSFLSKPVVKPYTHQTGAKSDQNNEVEDDMDSEIDLALENDRDPGDDLLLDEDRDPDGELLDKEVADHGGGAILGIIAEAENVSIPQKPSSQENGFSPENVTKLRYNIAVEPVRKSHIVTSVGEVRNPDNEQSIKEISKGENRGLLKSGQGTWIDNSTIASIPLLKRKKKQVMPPTSIPEMNRLLLRNRVSSRSMKPRWSSVRDQEILAAKKQIENAPFVKNDPELYAPVFRNVSVFKRSYELMESMLKVYVYREGGKPIFHTPILKGIYASEGWFMRLMEGNRRFLVKDPQKAHLFYMPFSSRFLEYALYIPGSHNRTNLVKHLKNYVDKIAAKYPFWNRTGGTDHFLVACHDWAPYETRHHMERSVRALCNADLNEGFKLGKDVSLPETFVRAQQHPLRDLGGKPASKRSTLAFFAGNMHGMLRPVLLQNWENKDPDMKIFGPMPRGIKHKMTYIQYMKSSKYCICPRGYEVNSPRVVEAIFYECVPVIISDNFVPPFFEVLDWEAFAVFVAEKDIPMLKDILLSIPEEKYRAMQMSVKKVQKHFLWHSKPVKYDIFYMILHSIWFNRVHSIKIR